ncbi:Crp/Fnr family transcriptional regulator [Tissierellaceae bacterium BX21]|jgi:CRP/FNR family transcriptional regulator|uniref:Crp/Fnr family transcriptional regulator n=2 Tax=Paratissierella segnis TaxID=2763679 RepID=A0A926EVX4_9FIRM|nr:Crp/Fnr family transcriptional regulator [Paratissierella segnis]
MKGNERNCIELVPIFSNLTQEEMLEVAAITSQKILEKGEMIYRAGEKLDRLYVIHSGKVKIARLNDSGKEQVIRILGQGDFLGELSLFSPTPMTDFGETLEKTTMCMIDGAQLKSLMLKFPGVAFKVMEELSSRLEKVENLVEDISLNSVEKRLANTLLKMSNDNNEVVLKMSKKDLASYIGMSQETLSRKLSYFQEIGLIKLVGHRRIILLDREGLSDFY